MNEKFVQIILTNAKIDPKVVMYLSIFKIGGWNILQLRNRNLFEEFLDENEPWLLDWNSKERDPFSVTQYLERHFASSHQHMKKLMSLRDMRQNFADRKLAV